MLELKNIAKEYNSKELFQNVSFSVAAGDKIALVGPNGAGKSTLLKIIAGIIEPDIGEVKVYPGISIGYLPQDFKDNNTTTVSNFLKEYCGLSSLEATISRYEGKDVSGNDLQEYNTALAEYVSRDGYSFDHKSDVMFEGFGLETSLKNVFFSQLSVGQRTKVHLIGLLLRKPDLLLLDEPTNNLDLPSIIWLEEYLKKSSVTLIVISHDISFLDAIIKKVAYIDTDKSLIEITKGTFSSFLERREKDQQRKLEEYKEFEEERNRLTERAKELRVAGQRGASYMGTDNDKFARGFKRDRAARSGKQAKNLEKQLEQMGETEKPIEKKDMQISIAPDNKGATIQFSDAVVGYESFTVGPFNLFIPFGTKLALIGPNGAGKSTVVKSLLQKELLHSGAITMSARVNIGNFMQQHENLPDEFTPVDFIRQHLTCTETEAYSLLAKNGFTADGAKKLIKVLSPGERARVLFAYFSGMNVNVLLLDEPTNHLDIDATEALLAMLEAYEGTVVMVTHDRSILGRDIISDLYLVSEHSIKHISDLKEYISVAEKKAKKLLLSIQ